MDRRPENEFLLSAADACKLNAGESALTPKPSTRHPKPPGPPAIVWGTLTQKGPRPCTILINSKKPENTEHSQAPPQERTDLFRKKMEAHLRKIRRVETLVCYMPLSFVFRSFDIVFVLSIVMYVRLQFYLSVFILCFRHFFMLFCMSCLISVFLSLLVYRSWILLFCLPFFLYFLSLSLCLSLSRSRIYL